MIMDVFFVSNFVSLIGLSVVDDGVDVSWRKYKSVRLAQSGEFVLKPP